MNGESTDNVFRPTSLDFEDFGRGWVVEEVSKEYETWKPVIQALKFEDGVWAIRFGYYVRDGDSWRWAVTGGMFLREEIIEDLKEEIRKSFIIKNLLEKLTK